MLLQAGIEDLVRLRRRLYGGVHPPPCSGLCNTVCRREMTRYLRIESLSNAAGCAEYHNSDMSTTHSGSALCFDGPTFRRPPALRPRLIGVWHVARHGKAPRRRSGGGAASERGRDRGHHCRRCAVVEPPGGRDCEASQASRQQAAGSQHVWHLFRASCSCRVCCV